MNKVFNVFILSIIFAISIPSNTIFAQTSVEQIEQEQSNHSLETIQQEPLIPNEVIQQDEQEQPIDTDTINNTKPDEKIQTSQPENEKEQELTDNDTTSVDKNTNVLKTIQQTDDNKQPTDLSNTINNKTIHKHQNRITKVILKKYNNLKKTNLYNRIIFIKKRCINKLSTIPYIKNIIPTKKPVVAQQSFKHTEIVPYYLITKEFSLNDTFFIDKITSITEMMPYHILIQNSMKKIAVSKNTITPEGTTDFSVLVNAPSPQITIKGSPKTAKLVIDIQKNTMYKYDKQGFPKKAYLVATGGRGTRTLPGLRIVTYKERFPYSGAPESKRGKNPYAYGPYIIFVNVINPETGRQYSIEQLLHGNCNESSIGKKVSLGCVRTNNKVMSKELSKEVTRGDYILLINPDIDT